MDGVAHYGPVGGDQGIALLTPKWTINVLSGTRLSENSGPRTNQTISLSLEAFGNKEPSTTFHLGLAAECHKCTGYRGGRSRYVHFFPCWNLILGTVRVEADATISLYGGVHANLIANSGSGPNPFKIQPATWYYFEVEVQILGEHLVLSL